MDRHRCRSMARLSIGADRWCRRTNSLPWTECLVLTFIHWNLKAQCEATGRGPWGPGQGPYKWDLEAVLVGYTCHPCYLGGRGSRIKVQGHPGQKQETLFDPIQLIN
jgi:hypothetical protein